MGIWVRSQNGIALCNANEIWVDGEDVYVNSLKIYIGKYNSEAEAIAVLDEIEEFLKGPNAREIFTGEYPKAFQMPEAGFSAKPKKEFTHEMYLGFANNMQADGYTDIPSEDEWRAKLVRECTIDRGCR